MKFLTRGRSRIFKEVGGEGAPQVLLLVAGFLGESRGMLPQKILQIEVS